MRKIISILLNIAIAAAACLLIWFLLDRSRSARLPEQVLGSARVERAKVGVSIPLSGINWSRSKKTLLIILKRDCQFCEKSIGFYKTLTDQISGRDDVKTVLIFPLTDADVESYLKSNKLDNLDLHKVNFTSTLIPFGIDSAPTLIVADEKGIISRIWVGQLSEAYERDVEKELGIVDNKPSNYAASDELIMDRIREDDLKLQINTGAHITIVDLRDRESYKNSHFPNARNIPGDEIRARALDELDTGNKIVIYSYKDSDTNSKNAYLSLKKDDFKNVAILNWSPPQSKSQ
jgi:rhodanese-related sulfurtransferase/thioredoxin-related protein